MRKLMMLLFGCSVGLAMQAQVTKLPEGFTSKKTVWIVRAGASFNSVTGDGVDATKKNWKKSGWSGDFKRAFGGNVSVGFNKLFGKTPIYWGMELGVAMRGYKTESDWSYSSSSKVSGGHDSHSKSQTETLNAFNAQLTPINIGYKYVINDKMAVDVHLGGFASYDFAGKLKTKNKDYINSTSKYGNNVKNNNSHNSVDISDLDDYRNFDFGVIGGVGFWYGHFNVDLGYQRGFVSMFDNDDSVIAISCWCELAMRFDCDEFAI